MPRIINFTKRPYTMAILNMTPDSFSGDGLLNNIDPLNIALKKVEYFLKVGSDIIDIGGESTRPRHDAQALDPDIELGRVIPIIEAIHQKFPKAFLSIDTRKAIVADKALQAGARIVNDVSGLMGDPDMIDVIIKHDAYIVIMHSHQNECIEQTELGGRYLGENNIDIVNIVRHDLEKAAIHAISRGVNPKKIILDPGIGFGKTVEQNLVLMRHLDQIKSIGFPVLVGVSRKSVVGYTVGVPVEQRLPGSIAANIMCLLKGANILRIHDPEETIQAIQIAMAIMGFEYKSMAS